MRSTFSYLNNCTLHTCSPFYVSYNLSRQFLKFKLNPYTKYAEVTFNLLKKIVISSYENCNGTLAKYPYYPNKTEQSLLTQEYKWLTLYVDPGQLNMFADPRKANVSIDGYPSFTHCVVNYITKETNKVVNATNREAWFIILGLASVAAISIATFYYCVTHFKKDIPSRFRFNLFHYKYLNNDERTPLNTPMNDLNSNSTSFDFSLKSNNDETDSFLSFSEDQEESRYPVDQSDSINNKAGVDDRENSLNML